MSEVEIQTIKQSLSNAIQPALLLSITQLNAQILEVIQTLVDQHNAYISRKFSPDLAQQLVVLTILNKES